MGQPESKPSALGRRILIKYLYRELFYYFLICFAFLFVVFFANQILLIGEDMLSKRAPFKDVAKIMIYSMPALIAQSAPFATLVGFLMCLGRMASDNEILIFRASGFSFRSILGPVLVLGMAISLVSFFVNDYLLPLGTIKYNQLYRQIMRSNPTVVLEPNSVKQIGSSTVVIGDVDDSKVSDIIFFTKRDSDEETIIVAGESVLVGAKNQGVLLQLDMSESMMTTFDLNDFSNYDVLSAEKTVLNIFDSVITGRSGKNPREMTFYDLRKEILSMKADPDEDVLRINTWMMEYYKKFAIPFGSIFFAFLAFSIAFLFGKHNGLTMGLFTGIIICVLYWAMQISGQLLVTRVNMDAFLCIWVPNILIAVIAVLLSVNLIRK
ncbi:MAG: LptF/LptG family permease [Treponema sp.]|nr:LptF/LptG family permease [Treponema sp.]MBR5033337.1 LptF/LptG family permease [Treponema sp.]